MLYHIPPTTQVIPFYPLQPKVPSANKKSLTKLFTSYPPNNYGPIQVASIFSRVGGGGGEDSQV